MNPKKLRISDAAFSDLTEIWIYISEGCPEIADGFLSKIYEKCELVAENPFIGRDRTELHAGLRSFPIQRYLIFYKVDSDCVEIVRVLSGYRDLEDIL